MLSHSPRLGTQNQDLAIIIADKAEIKEDQQGDEEGSGSDVRRNNRRIHVQESWGWGGVSTCLDSFPRRA